jgi:dCTP diphosphatase
MSEIVRLTDLIRQFRDERDWMQFHGHKDLAVSLVLEASELLEHFQWMSKEEVEAYGREHASEIGDEIADVAIHLLELADNLGLDLGKLIEQKLEKNAKKYPVAKARGSNLKYDRLPE